MALERGVVIAHARDGAPESLHAHGSPARDPLPLAVRVLFPLVPGDRPLNATAADPIGEGQELLVILHLQPMHQRHDAPVVLLEQLLAAHEDLLAVVRNENSDAGEVGAAEGPRHWQPEAAAQRCQPPHDVRIARLVPVHDAAISVEASLRGVPAPEGVRHLDAQHLRAGGGRGRGRGAATALVQRSGQVFPNDAVAGRLHVEGQVRHGGRVDVVLVSHVRDDAVPDQREVRGKAGRLPPRLLRRELRVV
mmetsp:Transcript_82899/g.239536  ORF Transcript_82899/g.239536 Transcript_82899/m.239536 type:complete len:250 (+) Transcript_82899:739-1488(+)